MTETPYLHLPGTTREALTFYGDVFGCEIQLHTFTEFNRADGPADAIAHGYLAGGPVALFAADVSGGEQTFRCEGMMLSLLGTAEPSTLRDWFSILADGGRVVDDLQKRPWGAYEGQVIDRYGPSLAHRVRGRRRRLLALQRQSPSRDGASQ